MEKPDKGNQDSELEASPDVEVNQDSELESSPDVEVNQDSELEASLDVEVTEQMLDEPQKPADHDNQMEDQIAAEISAETSNEKSVGLQDNSDYETDEIQPKVEQCEESMEKLQEAPQEMEHEAISGKCQEPGTSQKTEGTAAEESSKPSVTFDFRFAIGEVAKYKPVEHTNDDKRFVEWIKKQEDKPEAEKDMEVEIKEQDKQPEAERDLEAESIEGEQPQQELRVQHAAQSRDLVLEEAVICDARQERMEEAENIEEPQKYAFREPSSE